MIFMKIRKTCKWVRIAVGSIAIITGIILGNLWFFLGVFPLIAGLVDFCPLCIFANKCDLPTPTETPKV